MSRYTDRRITLPAEVEREKMQHQPYLTIGWPHYNAPPADIWQVVICADVVAAVGSKAHVYVSRLCNQLLYAVLPDHRRLDAQQQMRLQWLYGGPLMGDCSRTGRTQHVTVQAPAMSHALRKQLATIRAQRGPDEALQLKRLASGITATVTGSWPSWPLHIRYRTGRL